MYSKRAITKGTVDYNLDNLWDACEKKENSQPLDHIIFQISAAIAPSRAPAKY